MARVPEAELARLKREADLVALVTAAGVALRRHGADLIGRCPFHDDQGPSLVVTPAKNLWHCLGACQAGGSVIDWVMRVERVSFRHAVELLQKREPAVSRAPRAVSTTNVLAPLVDRDADDDALARSVVDYYHQTLLESPEAIRYLDARGLNDRALIERFQLGFANRTLGYRLPKAVLKAGAEVRGRLQQLGFLRASGHEHLTGSVVVPIVGERGRIAQCYGRKITPNLRAGTPVHCYLPGPHAAVWNVDVLAAAKEIILCEALLDALTCWRAGLTHVITSYGVSGFTDAHRAALRHHGTERVLIAYDADEAGDRAAERAADELHGMGIGAYRVNFPRGFDVNAYALAHAPAAESLAALVQNATWIGRGAPLVLVPADITNAPIDEQPPASSLAAAGAADRPAAAVSLTIEHLGDDIHARRGDVTYRVRGLAKNQTAGTLRVNLCAARGPRRHVDTLDLYSAKARAGFITHAAAELDVRADQVKQDVGALVLALEDLVTQERAAAQAPAPATESAAPVMNAAEREAALALLRDPNLVGRIVADIAAAGIVGEESNALLAYLAAVSRKLPEPLAVIIQSASAAGKTSLMDAVLAFVPPEDRVQYSAVTGQALFYLAETGLAHKVLAVVEEEGAERAAYALKLLQSEGELTIASTGKDPATGKLVTHTYRVAGPVMIMLTTTAVDLDEELVNRALVLTVDESPAQTRAIHIRQRARRTLAGRLAQSAAAEVLAVHRNAQRLLQPITVVNPFAPELSFADARTRTRRDHEKYLTLIETIALLHQHQREHKTVRQDGRRLTYIEVTRDDITLADRLAAPVLARGLDELPPQTRRFLAALTTWLTGDQPATRALRFRGREARAATGLGATQVKLHLRRLIDLEYVAVHRAPHGHGIEYELVYDAADDVAVDILHAEPAESEARSDLRSAPGRGVVGPRSGGGRTRRARGNAVAHTTLADDPPAADTVERHAHSNGRVSDPSYVVTGLAR